MANITRRDPMFGGERTLSSLQRNMDELFDELFRWSENIWPFVEGSRQGGVCIDVIDRDKDILIKADVPGFDRKDINIEVAEDNVVITGKHEEKIDKKDEEKVVVKERPQEMSFERLIPLTAKVLPNKAKATLKNGVLEIIIPKAEPSRKKSVKIKVK